MFGLGGNKSKSKSTSTQESFDISSARQSIAFEDLFSTMYGNAATKAAGLSGAGFGESASSLFSGGMQFLANLGGGPAMDYMKSRIAGPDEALQAQIGTLREQMGQLFREEINPAITSEAVRAGGLGGGRQGVAQGVAAGGLAREFASGVSGLMASSQAARDALASEYARTSTAAAGTGLQGLQSLLGIAQAREGAPLFAESMLAQILGSPTVLSESFSLGTSKGTSTSKGKSGGFSLGFG